MATAKQLILEAVDELNNLDLFELPLRVKSKTLAIIVQTLNAQLAMVDAKKFWKNISTDTLDILETNGVALPPEKKKKSMSAEAVVNPDFEDKKAAKKLKKEAELLTKIIKNKDLPKKERKKAKKQLKALLKSTTCTVTKETEQKSTAGRDTPTKGPAARAERPIPEKISWPREESITGTIVSYCQKKPRTLAQIIKKLEKTFPERPVSGMTKTVGSLVGGKGVPLPLHYTKGIPCEVENDGTPEKTVFINASK